MRALSLLLVVAALGCEERGRDIGRDPARVGPLDAGEPMPSSSAIITAPPSASSGRDPFKPPDDVGDARAPGGAPG